ncbi:MAG: uracil phosphoribosyltransferase [Rhodospirillaceae bacterium]|nr:uracil phosphoribosyltransferase [Rhodospirillaceae bacterium]
MPLVAPHPGFPTARVLAHPVVADVLTRLREHHTPTAEFRRHMAVLAKALGLASTLDLEAATRPIRTPLEEMEAPALPQPAPAIVAVLRAGLALSDHLVDLMPDAVLGQVGLRRDPETLEAVSYLTALPNLAGRPVLVCDPMLATGGSLVRTLQEVVDHGAAAAAIRVLTVIAAPEGLARVAEAFPQVVVYTCAVDSRLDENAYIRPGLGDAGDRYFGTPH